MTHAIWDVPLTRWTGTTGRVHKLLLDGWQISGVFTAQTGLPANVTNAASANATDCPDAAGGGISPYSSGYQTGIHQYLNPAAFVMVPISPLSSEQIRPGNLSNQAVRIPGFQNLDLTLAKSFALAERFRLQSRADTFNTLKSHDNPAFRRVAGRQAIETGVVRSAGLGVTTEQNGVAERPTIPFPSGTAL